jgi:putative endonuclease
MWYLYICNKKGSLYTGITTDIDNRIRQHSYAELLYVEKFQDKRVAAKREREIKGWRREKKLDLVHSKNKPVSLP